MFAPRSARETVCSPDPRPTSEQTVACEGHLIAGTTPQSRLRQAAQSWNGHGDLGKPERRGPEAGTVCCRGN